MDFRITLGLCELYLALSGSELDPQTHALSQTGQKIRLFRSRKKPMRRNPFMPGKRRDSFDGKLQSKTTIFVAKRSMRKFQSKAWFFLAICFTFSCGLIAHRKALSKFSGRSTVNKTPSLVSYGTISQPVESGVDSIAPHRHSALLELQASIRRRRKHIGHLQGKPVPRPQPAQISVAVKDLDARSDSLESNRALKTTASLNSEREVSRNTSELYDFSSTPPEALEFARKWISVDPACEHDPRNLQVACCRAHCGGISDRAKGLMILTVVAAKSGRQLCLNEDYFMSAPWPKCENGAYLYIGHQKSVKYNTPAVKHGAPSETIEALPEDLSDLHGNIFAGVRFIASSYATKVKEIGVSSGRIDAKKFGMMAIAFSGVLRDKMAESRILLRERVGSKLGNSYVALNVRCGESHLRARNGKVVLSSSNHGFHDGFESTMPGKLLDLMRKLPRGLTCEKALFLSTDSVVFREEAETAMPSGIRVVSCCSSPVHVGYGPDNKHLVTREEGLQHLVDLIAMGESSFIFKGDGGFTELGAVAKSWRQIKFRSWPGMFENQKEKSNDETQRSFMNNMLETLKCDQATL